MRKVISYSLYSSDRKNPIYYINGLLLNLDLAKIIYPDFKISVYLQDKFIDLKSVIENKGGNVILKKYEGNNQIPSMWRYTPLVEGNFDLVLFRDTDSLLTKRERDLVNKFEKSDKKFHIIRDHPHHTMKILAGMWGAKQTSPVVSKIIEDCYKLDGVYGYEEKYFQEHLYNEIKDNALEHDSNKTPEEFNTYPGEYNIGCPYA